MVETALGLMFICTVHSNHRFRFRRPIEERVVNALGKQWHVEVGFVPY